MAFTTIPTGAVVADSPLDATLFGYIKDNDDYLKSRLVTGTGHTHNQGGTDEGGPVVPADNSVTIQRLSRAQGSQNYSGSSDGTYYLTIPSYTHNAYAVINTGPATVTVSDATNGLSSGTVRQITVTITGTNANSNITVYWDYHT